MTESDGTPLKPEQPTKGPFATDAESVASDDVRVEVLAALDREAAAWLEAMRKRFDQAGEFKG